MKKCAVDDHVPERRSEGELVITKLIGGLGNQMFQYAMARRMAYLHNETLKLDITGFKEYRLRDYYLHQLNIEAEIATAAEIDCLKRRRIKEEFFHFDPWILRLRGGLYFEGYWQSEKYFKDIAKVIRSEFTVKIPLSGANLKLADRIKGCEAVAVHFRRGDYVTNPVTNQYHGICAPEYYRRAAREIANQVPDLHFFLFSDDPEWVAQSVYFEYPVTIVAVNRSDKPHEDLRLMSFCKYHIIANSTFSWWGAWLGTHPGKIVYAPKKWFDKANLYIWDLIPEEWCLL
jgi:hypothetical protein